MGELEIFTIRIKELRESLKMTQKSFSEYIGIKQQTLSGYERGIMKPSLDIVIGIAEKCHVSIDWLCGLSEHQKPDNEFQTYGDIISVLFAIQDCTKIRLDEDSESFYPYLTFNGEPLNPFLEEWRDATNVLKSSSINKETAKSMYEFWKRSKIEELSKINIEEDSRDSDNE